jgi:ribonucleoside-diphosphate reductase alpha chain
MLGATQPFISGAISKTINMPESSTVEDIADAYLEGWKLGLKAVAIYRDGCKRSQPLSTRREDALAVEPQAAVAVAAPVAQPVARRVKLPDERRAITHKFSVNGHEGYITVGLYDNGQPGEIFLTMAKQGSTVSGLVDAFATGISIALQYGVPLRTLVDKFSHTRFEPAGFTTNPEIPMAKSITDYIFRWLASKFLPVDEQRDIGVILREVPPEAEALAVSVPDPAPSAPRPVAVAQITTVVEDRKITFLNSQDAPSCHVCGSIMVRNGSCYKCMECGETSGCS